MERTSFWRSLNTRERWGWVIYDWADSAFVLCVITVIGAGYFVHMFEKSAQEAGTLMVGSAPALPFAGLNLTGEGAWSLLVGLSAFIVAVSSPIMGAIADAGKLRLRFLVGYCLIGVLATLTLAFPLPWWAIGLAILIGNVGYEGGNVYYNSFLPDIGTAKEQDALSSAGYAFGYLGGVLVLIAALFLFVLPPDGEIRNSFLLVGLWWGGFALFTFTWVRESPVKQTTPPVHQISHAWQEVKRTLSLL
ncbi:MAG: MFS transporter, partial [Deltaproteobacteria bacterium]|nr:MFS transporter [Deltaproteobacteria bacterium]